MPRRKRSSTPQPLSEILPSAIRTMGLEEKVRDRAVIAQWSSIVGERIAANTKARSVRSGRLLVDVASPVWLQELTLIKPILLARIHAHLDDSSVHDIVFLNRGSNK